MALMLMGLTGVILGKLEVFLCPLFEQKSCGQMLNGEADGTFANSFLKVSDLRGH